MQDICRGFVKFENMDLTETRELWIDCVVVAIVVFLTFILIVSFGFMNWMGDVIPDLRYRTICAGCLLGIVAFITTAFILRKRKDDSYERQVLKEIYSVPDDVSYFP